MTKASTKEQRQWQAESDVRTLLEADAIKADRARLKQAQAMANKQMVAVKKIANKRSKK